MGYSLDEEFARRCIASKAEAGVPLQHAHALVSRSFGRTPMAAYLVDLLGERDG